MNLQSSCLPGVTRFIPPFRLCRQNLIRIGDSARDGPKSGGPPVIRKTVAKMELGLLLRRKRKRAVCFALLARACWHAPNESFVFVSARISQGAVNQLQLPVSMAAEM